MVLEKSIAVIIPAYNEGKLITKTLETMPDFVDAMIVINDCSIDDTPQRIIEYSKKDPRVIMLEHDQNKGLGQTLIDGYVKSLEFGYDIMAVMAGDAQMDPDDLIRVVTPVAEKRTDYVKGHRLFYEGVRESMPKYRFFGNSILSFLTKFATGYWSSIDPQCGYTAISREALSKIPITRMTKGYGYNADILNMLNIADCTVLDVEVRPVYGEEKSKIKLAKYIVRVSGLLIKLFFRRMKYKYIVRDFNPLVFFYILAIICVLVICLPMTIRFFIILGTTGELAKTTALIFAFSLLIGLQSLFFGMWMDMQDNKRLNANDKE